MRLVCLLLGDTGQYVLAQLFSAGDAATHRLDACGAQLDDVFVGYAVLVVAVHVALLHLRHGRSTAEAE